MIGDILRRERKKLHLTQADVGAALGVSQQAVAKWENNATEPRPQDLVTLASMYNVTVDYLLGRELQPDAGMRTLMRDGSPYKTLPVLSSVACGEPIYAEDNYEDYILQNMEINADFCVIAKGDSMINARIHDGDIVFVHKQDMVTNGEIAVVAIDDTATIKRVFYSAKDAKLVLMPENPNHAPLVYVREELNHARILGKVVSFFSRINSGAHIHFEGV